MHHPLNQALAAVALGLFIYGLIAQHARGKLTAEHLFLLEKNNRLKFSSFVPMLPLIVVSVTGTYFPLYRNAQLICGVIIAFVLFIISAWNSKMKVAEQGLPLNYIKAMFTAECLLGLSFLVAMSPMLYHLE